MYEIIWDDGIFPGIEWNLNRVQMANLSSLYLNTTSGMYMWVLLHENMITYSCIQKLTLLINWSFVPEWDANVGVIYEYK